MKKTKKLLAVFAAVGVALMLRYRPWLQWI